MRRVAAQAAGLLCTALLASALAACKPARPTQTVDEVAGAPSELPAERLIVRASEAPVVELRLVFDAGSADDPQGREGLTYVMLKSMLEGRAGNLSYAERTRALYPMAAVLQGHVGREQLVIAARVHIDHLERFYPLLRDVLRAPAFERADVERVRVRAMASLTQDLRGGDDEELGKQTLQAMIYEGGPGAHPELGSETGLSSVQSGDVSAQWGRLICSQRLRVAISGPVSEAFLSGLRSDLGALDRPACTGSTPAVASEAQAAATRVWIVDKPEAQSIAISLGVPTQVTREHPDYAALTLAAAYLGQHRTFAGRLMRQVREERGLNYGDYAYAEHFEQDGDSRFPAPNVARHQQYFSIWIRPVRPEQAHFALRLVWRELRRIVSEGVGPDEFQRIQRFADRYYALYAQTEQQRLGHALDDRFYHRSEPYLDSLRAAFRALTREQLVAAVKRHLALERVQIAIVAPNAAAFAKQLVEGAPSPITYSSEKPAAILEEDKGVVSYPLGLREEQFKIIPIAEWFP
jgi:zinc protease